MPKTAQDYIECDHCHFVMPYDGISSGVVCPHCGRTNVVTIISSGSNWMTLDEKGATAIATKASRDD